MVAAAVDENDQGTGKEKHEDDEYDVNEDAVNDMVGGKNGDA